MKKVIIFHGTGSTPDSYWHPYLKTELEKKGYHVEIPALPNTEHPKLTEQLPFALEQFSYDEDTILVGHSSGVPLILSVLESINQKIRQAVLASGFFEPINPPEPEPMLQDTYNWEMIKEHCNHFIVLNSDNDPWGCTDAVGRKLAENLDGRFVFMEGEGHMGSGKFNQPYKEFPRLLELID